MIIRILVFGLRFPFKLVPLSPDSQPMDKSFEIMLQHRKTLYHYLKELPPELLNTIPTGFRNNIVWNIGHTIVTQQMLVYRLSGLTAMVSDEMVSRYRKGTAPEENATDQEIDALKKLLFTTVEKTTADYQLGVFQEFKSHTTITKVTLNRVEDAILFNNFHEGLHLGTIMALQKVVS